MMKVPNGQMRKMMMMIMSWRRRERRTRQLIFFEISHNMYPTECDDVNPCFYYVELVKINSLYLFQLGNKPLSLFVMLMVIVILCMVVTVVTKPKPPNYGPVCKILTIFLLYAPNQSYMSIGEKI
jgi:hypothetical protein